MHSLRGNVCQTLVVSFMVKIVTHNASMFGGTVNGHSLARKIISENNCSLAITARRRHPLPVQAAEHLGEENTPGVNRCDILK